jgi:hypothetical protein
VLKALRHASIPPTDSFVPVTGFVVLLWDHLLTFEDEIEYIWKWPVQPSKVVFLFNRYFVEAALCLSVYGKFWELAGHTK